MYRRKKKKKKNKRNKFTSEINSYTFLQSIHFFIFSDIYVYVYIFFFSIGKKTGMEKDYFKIRGNDYFVYRRKK